MKIFVVFFFLWMPLISIAQQKNKKATIVTSDNDTIYGIVDDKEWLSNPSVIRIKKKEQESFKEYAPQQLKSVRINDGDYYESYFVKIDATPLDFEGPTFDSSLISNIERHAFLLVQFSNADLTLYSYKIKNQFRFYLKRGNETPKELLYRKYTVRRENGIFEMEDNSFMDQLMFLAGNCTETDKKLTTLNYELPDMLDLLKIYYKSCGRNMDTYLHTQPGKGKFTISLMAGMSKSSLSFTGTNPDAVFIGVITRTPLKTDASFVPGFRVNYLIPRAHQKFSIFFDLYYNQYTASTSEYLYNNAPNDYQTKSLTIDLQYIHTALGLRYFLSKETSLRPFLHTGFSESFILSYRGEAIYNKQYFGVNTITADEVFANNSLKKSSFGGFFGAGLKYKNLGVDIRYHMMGSLANYNAIKSPQNAVTLFFSYQFNL